MVNILVPTDFSRLSLIAVKYAVRISNKLGGDIILLHVVDLQKSLKERFRIDGNPRQLVRQIEEELEKIVAEVAAEITLKKKPRFKISQGNLFSDTILKESKRFHCGLIVMGTKGASGMKKTFLGSNTVSVISESHIPVLAVPEKAEFKSFRNVIYATNLKDLDKQLSVIIPLIERFGSTIHILHVVDHGRVRELEEKIEAAVAKTGYKNIVILVTMDHDIESAILHYISLSKADLVAMFTHKPTFYERLLDKSVTRKLAFHSRIPLLAFRQSEGD